MFNATNSEENAPSNLPTTAEMLEMLNVDILPFFDDYDATTITFAAKYRAVAIASQTSRDVMVELNNGAKVEIAKIYFQFPCSEKANVIQRLHGTLS